MPVTKEELAQYVSELGLPQEQTDSLVSTLLGNERAATQFVGQRLRHADYTKKTQDLANHKATLETQATEQITQYANQLVQAQNRISSIMGDLEKEHITAATANARLRSVKEKYNLSDEDVPSVEGVAKPAGNGANPNDRGGGGIDIDAKLQSFQEAILKTVRQDMLSMPRVTAIQSDIMEEHRELTGKRMSREEMNEVLAHAEKNKMRLEDAWKDKYKIDDLRFNQRLESEVKKKLDEADTQRKAKASEDALAGVQRRQDITQVQNPQSPVLGRKYNEFADPVATRPAADKSPATPDPGSPRLSGAERAAAKFLERRSMGIPLGAPPAAQ